MSEKYPPLIVVLGPTASGKSELALSLAEHMDGEIVCADSRQIYKNLNIGTAKPDSYDRKRVPHHLVDIVDILEEFTLNDFQKSAMNAILDIYDRGKIPFLVGGTALYIKAVTEGLHIPFVPPDLSFRRKMKDFAVKEGIPYLYEKLQKEDPVAAGKIHKNDLRRIIRALEVFESSSRSIITLQNERNPVPFKSIKIGIKWPREILYNRIEKRVDKMFNHGFIDEVLSLLKSGYTFRIPPLDALGYPEVSDYLKGRANLKETGRIMKRNTRRFSKRQMTWFKKDKEIFWFEQTVERDGKKILEEIKSFLEEKYIQ